MGFVLVTKFASEIISKLDGIRTSDFSILEMLDSIFKRVLLSLYFVKHFVMLNLV